MTHDLDFDLTIQQVAKFLRVSESTVRRMENDGELNPSRLNESGHRRYNFNSIFSIQRKELMFIKNPNLFSSGNFMCGTPALSDVLQHHKNEIVRKIQNINLLDEMTDEFLKNVMDDAMVKPLVLKVDDKSHELRTENIPAELFPFDFNVQRGHSYPKSVVTISIPCEGGDLFNFAPKTQSLRLPQGRLSGDYIEFDSVFFGGTHDEKTKKDIDENIQLLELFVERCNNDINDFNKSLPEVIRIAFNKKFDELEKQVSLLESIGIKAKAKESAPQETQTLKISQAKKQVAVHIEHFTINIDKINQDNKYGNNIVGGNNEDKSK